MRVPLRSRAHDPTVSGIEYICCWSLNCTAKFIGRTIHLNFTALFCGISAYDSFFYCNLCIFAEIRQFKPFTHVSWIYDRLCVIINFCGVSYIQAMVCWYQETFCHYFGNSESYKKRQWWSSVTGLSTQLNHKLLSAKSWQSLVGHSLGRY